MSVVRSRPRPPAERQLKFPKLFTSGFGRWGTFGEFVCEVFVAAASHTLFLKKNQVYTLLESIGNLLQNPYDSTHLTLGMLLHYLGKLKIQIFCRYSAEMAEMQTNSILIASNFVIHPQILIFSVLK